jgi:hypothetical protein
MITMTNGRNLESRTKPFENGNGAAKPKSDPKIELARQPAVCGWYITFKEKPESMSKGTMESFIKEHGCYECEGYKNAKCGDKI